jgi:hypothetical protein
MSYSKISIFDREKHLLKNYLLRHTHFDCTIFLFNIKSL